MSTNEKNNSQHTRGEDDAAEGDEESSRSPRPPSQGQDTEQLESRLNESLREIMETVQANRPASSAVESDLWNARLAEWRWLLRQQINAENPQGGTTVLQHAQTEAEKEDEKKEVEAKAKQVKSPKSGPSTPQPA